VVFLEDSWAVRVFEVFRACGGKAEINDAWMVGGIGDSAKNHAWSTL
jgi:hypothetical protein